MRHRCWYSKGPDSAKRKYSSSWTSLMKRISRDAKIVNVGDSESLGKTVEALGA